MADLPIAEASVVSVESRRSVAISIDSVFRENRLLIHPEIEGRGYFSVSFRGQELLLTAGPYIGLIPINDSITIDVRPKLPVSNLARVIDVAHESLASLESFTRLYDESAEAAVSVLEFLAKQLLLSFEEVERRGLLKTYLTRLENSSHPRGRIHVNRTIKVDLSRQIRHRVVHGYFAQSIDCPENRLIKRALWLLAERFRRLPSRNRLLMRDLNAKLRLFDSIPLDPSSEVLAHVTTLLRQNKLPAARRYYAIPLKISLTIAAGRTVSLTTKGDHLALSSFVLNFEEIFEAYIRQALRQEMSRTSPSFRVRDGNHEARRRLFDEVRDPPAQPDIVVDDGNRAVRLVVEVKYKDRFDRSDINQAITYACVYRTHAVMLVHQAGPGTGSSCRKIGTIEDKVLYGYAFDLASSNLPAEERALAASVRDLCGAP